MSNITTFNFDALQVRAVLRDGEPWFVAADVCAALEIADVRQAVERLDDSERGGCTVPTPGGPQEVRAVNESGMYALIFTSRKPEAQQFRRWVTSDVLPSIRRTGGYTMQPQKTSSAEDMETMRVLADAERKGAAASGRCGAAPSAARSRRAMPCTTMATCAALLARCLSVVGVTR